MGEGVLPFPRRVKSAPAEPSPSRSGISRQVRDSPGHLAEAQGSGSSSPLQPGGDFGGESVAQFGGKAASSQLPPLGSPPPACRRSQKRWFIVI